MSNFRFRNASQFSRRQFIEACALGVGSVAMPFHALAQDMKSPNRTLVLVEFHGGNDGLNTLIPHSQKAYYDLRPNIHIPKKEQVILNDTFALNPALKPLIDIFEDEQAAVILGLGYESPNRSHFRSIEIWDTASNSEEFLIDGWLAKANSEESDVGLSSMADAIVIGRNAAPVLSKYNRTIIIDSIEKFYRQARAINKTDSHSNGALGHLLKTQNQTKAVAELLKKKINKLTVNVPEFEGGGFGRDLQEVARLILIGNTAPVIKVSLGGFDTHQNQRNDQEKLLDQFANGMKSFKQFLSKTGLWNDVLVMTYSEFGRRVAENGSGGTDHGTAAPHFVFGGKVNGGFYGQQPVLDNLDQGDLIFTTHFHSYYQTVMANWQGAETNFNAPLMNFIKT